MNILYQNENAGMRFGETLGGRDSLSFSENANLR